MSRLGKKPIVIPEKTEVMISGSTITVKGPLGELKKEFHPEMISIVVANNEVTTSLAKDTLESRALWGTYVSHIKNMIAGVNQLYQKKLILEGVGYKTEVKPEELVLIVGYSHHITLKIPKGLKVINDKTGLSISGIDKDTVGRFASEVRSKRKPEPYKGKGFRYDTEVIRRKQGKKSA